MNINIVNDGSSKQRIVAMVGPAIDMPGGMSAVIKTYEGVNLFIDGYCVYIPSYAGSNALGRLRTFLRCIGQTLSLMMRRRLRILHLHSASRGSFWRKAILTRICILFKIPYIFHIHSGEFINWYGSLAPTSRRIVRNVLLQSSKVLCLTGGWKISLEQLIPGIPVEVLVNPVVVPANAVTIRDKVETIVFLGRLRETKGINELVDAFYVVSRTNREIMLVLAGDELKEDLLQRVALLGLQNRVRFSGWIDGVAKHDLLMSSDIFVLPSYFEGLPIGLLEAMAYGLPSVATSVGGIPDVISNSHDGILVGPKNSAELADALIRLINSTELRASIGKNARREIIRSYSAEKVVNKLRSIYAEVSP